VSKALLAERRYAEGWLQRSAQLAKSLHDETLEVLPSSQVCRQSMRTATCTAAHMLLVI
jgi:hypothetical protein